MPEGMFSPQSSESGGFQIVERRTRSNREPASAPTASACYVMIDGVRKVWAEARQRTRIASADGSRSDHDGVGGLVDHPVLDRADAVNLDADQIAGFEKARRLHRKGDSGRRAGRNDRSGQQGAYGGEGLDLSVAV